MESPRFKMGTQYSQVRTVKDVAFLGGRSEYVISGSDDGMAYIYRKSDGALLTRLHGDSNVVNTFASHPSACTREPELARATAPPCAAGHLV